MANKKISELSTLPQTNFANNDSIPIVDQSDAETKRTTIGELDMRWAAKTHSHVISDVTNLQDSLDGKANTSHSHAISDVTGLSTALSGKANTSHSHVAADITDFESAVQLVKPSRNVISEWDDFSSAVVAGKLAFTSTVAGTGAAIARNNAIAASFPDVYGNTQLSTGTTATGRASYTLAIDSTYFNGMQHTIEWKMKLDFLSSVGVEQFFVHCGWGDQTAAGDQVDGVYFKYDATSNANWLAVTSSNSIRETSDTGVPVTATAYNNFTIVVNNTATQAMFYINDVLVATNTLNIPASQARACGPLVKIEKQVGLTARTIQVDRVQIDSIRP